jgi:hypothetical protein
MFTVGEKLDFLTLAFGLTSQERKGNVAVWCPICNSQKRDKLKLVIRLSDDLVHCWSCSFTSTSLVPLLKKYNPSLLSHYLDRFYVKRDRTQLSEENNLLEKNLAVKLPENFKLLVDKPKEDVVEYVCSRGLTLDDAWKFKLGTSTELPGRLIIPSFDSDGSLNYYTARGIDKKTWPRYKNSDADKKYVIFNELNVDWTQELTLVEGPFDAMKCPDNTVSMLGSEIRSGSMFNESFLLFDRICAYSTPVVIALDGDMWTTKTIKIAKLFNSYGIRVRIADTRNFEDPGSVSKSVMTDCLREAKEFNFYDSLLDRMKNVSNRLLF